VIDEAAMRKAFAALKARVDYLERASGLFATDDDLDGQYGNPQIKFSPRSWSGENFTGKRFSETTAEFLDVFAETLQYSADNPKEGKEKYAKYSRVDAGRARAWARRLRAGWRPPNGAASADHEDFLR
jgi:hypothetical protein